ncbi:MAG: hypothetical protein OXE77_07960 [Flavobacteriaceae bacterium]|nr:hypothetical protein [Flavobacteriaceae bacterium]
MSANRNATKNKRNLTKSSNKRYGHTPLPEEIITIQDNLIPASLIKIGGIILLFGQKRIICECDGIILSTNYQE